ncbi:hypothetical protein N7931_02640 [Catenovulum sp. 2E275]|uniref:hypothetical protein n=1 Tax=Catenovulum sp. 2E275 TaxID=2980497 RepID=UPI0021D330FF|nr:hypothetical protein [Catenovulum sp. 2E275]MCU4674519.1 hypothetical protein [Catenovulum sp. 2E275]
MKKNWNTYKVIRLFTWGIGGTALIIFYIWFEFFTPKAGLNTPANLGFNPLVWAKSSQDYSATNPRQYMYLDVVKNHIENGLKRFEIDKKLGTPDYIDDQKTYYYLLNYELNKSDFNYLVIHFDHNDLVNLFYYTSKKHKL